jgi:hypothetical protein
VRGERHVGNKYRYVAFNTPNRNRAKRFVDAHPPGREVTVYYHPRDPGDSVLTTGIEGMDLFMALFLTPFNLVMLALWGWQGRTILSRFRPPEAGGVPILRREYGVHLRLPRFPPLGCAAAAGGAVAFAGIFAIAFGFGMGESIGPVLVVWGLVLGTFVVVYLRRRFRAGEGLDDLIIDLEHQEFSLPQTYGRDGTETYPLDWIDDATVKTRVQRGSKGSTSTSFLPTLNFTDAGGNQHEETLGEWASEAAAQGLVDWLNRRVSRAAREERGGAQPGEPL